MALTYPLSLAFVWDLLPIASMSLAAPQQDELSGTGDGRIWSAELAPTLWRAEVTLAKRAAPIAKQHVARIRSFRGAREAFYIADPLSPFPASDPDGSALAGAAVTASAIAGNRRSISLAGLPAGYVLTPGDKMSISYGTAPTHIYFGEISQPGSANGSGVLANIAVFPDLPFGIAAGAAVTLARPFFKAVIAPETFQPGTAARVHIDGIGFTAIQKA